MNDLSLVTSHDIEHGLGELGLGHGDIVLVHSSLKSFGKVEGGAEAVIEALMNTVGSGGCVVVPTLTLGAPENPVIFDVRNSPSTSGYITNVFRQMPEARRSLHPTSSAAAIGLEAEDIAAHHADTPCGLASPYGQVYERDGWCLFLGTTWNCNTMFHVAEELAAPNYMRYADFHDARVIGYDGITSIVSFRRYNCYQTGVKRDLTAMERYFESAGAVRHVKIGLSECMLIRAKDVVYISVDLLQTHPEVIASYTS